MLFTLTKKIQYKNNPKWSNLNGQIVPHHLQIEDFHNISRFFQDKTQEVDVAESSDLEHRGRP